MLLPYESISIIQIITIMYQLFITTKVLKTVQHVKQTTNQSFLIILVIETI